MRYNKDVAKISDSILPYMMVPAGIRAGLGIV
jgi:hypothetical protein